MRGRIALAWLIVAAGWPPVVLADDGQTRLYLPAVIRRPGEADCRDILVNGGFESERGWKFTQYVADRIESDLGATPHSGAFMLALRPRDRMSVRASSDSVKLPPASTITSATFVYHVLSMTADAVRYSDDLSVYLHRPNNTGADSVLFLDTRRNQDATWSWRDRSFNITHELVDASWEEVNVDFTARNDVSDPSRWYVDDVSLIVCNRP